MSNDSPAYIQYLKDTNKYLSERLKETQAELKKLQEENWILRDEVSAWENTARINGWTVTNLLYPSLEPVDEDIPF